MIVFVLIIAAVILTNAAASPAVVTNFPSPSSSLSIGSRPSLHSLQHPISIRFFPKSSFKSINFQRLHVSNINNTPSPIQAISDSDPSQYPRVFVDGQAGTTGLRIREYLQNRSDIRLLQIADHLRKDTAERARLLNEADIVFLCLPDQAAIDAVNLITNPSTIAIDASTAHRTDQDWVYGLPEMDLLQRSKIRQSKRISNPGCHATAFILLVRPLIHYGMLENEFPITAQSITAYSGGGRQMIEQYEADDRPERMRIPQPYALGLQHKHIPEMMQHSKLRCRPIFMPVIGDFPRGLSVSIPIRLETLGLKKPAFLHKFFTEHYKDDPFIRVVPQDEIDAIQSGQQRYDITSTRDTNQVDIYVFGSKDQAILMACLDNLGKGASGAAIQSMNIALGLPEQTGL